MPIRRLVVCPALAVAAVLTCDPVLWTSPSHAQTATEAFGLPQDSLLNHLPDPISSEPAADQDSPRSEVLAPDEVFPVEGETAPPTSDTPLPPYSAPNLNPTQIPSAFVAEWGNYFLSSYIYGYDDGSSGGSLKTDGGISVGMGFGDSRKYFALEVDFNLESLANTNNGGTLDVRLGRHLYSTHNFVLQLGGGWLGVASYGSWPKQGGSPYGVLTAAWALRPNDPVFRQTLQVNLGGGGGRFQRLDAVDLVSNGLIASVGVELAPNLGISAGWAGRGLNASLSYVPLRGVPLSLSLSGANITNVDGTGRAVAFGITWGGSFRTATFP
jgi:hypothetical protein